MEDPDGHLEAWPLLQRLVPIAVRLHELLEELPEPDPEELALDLDGLLAPYAWAHSGEWAIATEVLAQVGEVLDAVEFCEWLPPSFPACEERRRRRPQRRR
jgi:hypothetical protein